MSLQTRFAPRNVAINWGARVNKIVNILSFYNIFKPYMLFLPVPAGKCSSHGRRLPPTAILMFMFEI